MSILICFVSGALFAGGLALSGMTQPAKVVGFLDVAGDWDPSLALVMVGAIAVYWLAYTRVKVLETPVFASSFGLPDNKDIDRRLLVGSGLFGIGWGLSGYCPGPALVSLTSGTPQPWIFCSAMVVGMLLFEVTSSRKSLAKRSTGLENTIGDAATPDG
jgi:uncharacterized membrane protein YedE/YeeE